MESISLREVLQRAACRIGSVEDSVWGDLDSASAGLTKVLLECLAESEAERRAGARLHERGECRTDYRNGYRKRMAQLSYQVVEIRIPRLRGQGFVPSFVEPGHRALAQVEGWVQGALMAGLSPSEVTRLMESTTGCRPSEKLLGRVRDELDKRVREFRERPLRGRYRYLFLDAAWAKDVVGVSATRICITSAVGVSHSQVGFWLSSLVLSCIESMCGRPIRLSGSFASYADSNMAVELLRTGRHAIAQSTECLHG